jgi:2-iminobutanoate/2-iminopropanoate deaminase
MRKEELLMKFINSPGAPAAIGPYSHAVSANGFIFLSGQLGLDPQTMTLVEGLEAQTHQTFKNIQAVLATLNKDLSHVIKTSIFLINMDDFAQVNIIYADYFDDHRPARSTIAVKQLPKNGLIEIECVVKE